LLLQNAVAQHSHVEFKENKGQWQNHVLFKAKLPAGEIYLEQNKLTYQFYNEKDIVSHWRFAPRLDKKPTGCRFHY
jgi:hypothetical protein